MKSRSWLAPGVVALAAVASSACVSQDAGYSDVQRTVARRVGTVPPRTAGDGASLLARPLSADDAVRVALLTNRNVQAALADVGVARAGLVHALRLPNPEIDGSLGFHRDQTDIEVGVMLDLTDLALLPLRESAARAELQAAALEASGLILDVALDAKLAWYDYVATTESLGLARSVLLAAHSTADLAERLHDAGNVSDLARDSEQAFYEEVRLDVVRAETERAAARERLSSALGVWGDDAARWSTPGRLPDPPTSPIRVDDIERRAVANSLDLDVARRRVFALDRRGRAARAEGVVPKIRGGVGVHRDERGWGPGPRVGLTLPLFYQGQGEIQAADAAQRREQERLEATAVALRASARAAATRLAAAHATLKHYREVLMPLRQRIVDGTQLEYNAMGVGAFQLLEAKRRQIETARAYVHATHDFWVARAEVDQLLAGRLPREYRAKTALDQPDSMTRAE